jgi:hypothetical protein
LSNTTSEPTEEPENRSISEVGRSTPLGTPTLRKQTGMRRRTELGFLLFLQYQARLSPGQWAYLLGLQRRSNLQEIDSAIELFKRLAGSRRSAARAQQELNRLLARTPHLSPKSVRREQRRIGVGYRDKGTLRLPHQDHSVLPRTWWWEDIAQILHLRFKVDNPEELLAEEELAKGDIHQDSNIVASWISFRTSKSSTIVVNRWRFPSQTLISAGSPEGPSG